MKLLIDQQPVELTEPLTLWQAASRLGISIPVLCHEQGLRHVASCMMCMVQDRRSGRLLPACSTPAADGMDIETVNDKIRDFRKSTLELLLSDHVGDCEAPCQRLCPIHLDIASMMRCVRAGDMPSAIGKVRRDIAIPSILERYCNVPCERGCRRGKHDQPLAIRGLVRHVADWDLRRDCPYIPERDSATGKRVVIVGAGASGLAVAYYLALRGHDCEIFERSGRIGGRIEHEFGGPIEDWVAEGELAILRKLGVTIRFQCPVADAAAWEQVRNAASAVVLACGRTEPGELRRLGLPVGERGLQVDSKTGRTELPGVFAVGSLVRAGQPLVKSVAAAKELAACVDQFLAGAPMVGLVERYNHTMGRLLDGEMEAFLATADPRGRLQLCPESGADHAAGDGAGLNAAAAAAECARCLHCDCRAKDDCLLREYSSQYGAKQSQFAGEERARIQRVARSGAAMFEPGKCIKCGLCVRVTERAGEPLGIAFIGRGFDVKVGAALGRPLEAGLGKVADEVIQTCPTGALTKGE